MSFSDLASRLPELLSLAAPLVAVSSLIACGGKKKDIKGADKVKSEDVEKKSVNEQKPRRDPPIESAAQSSKVERVPEKKVEQKTKTEPIKSKVDQKQVAEPVKSGKGETDENGYEMLGEVPG